MATSVQPVPNYSQNYSMNANPRDQWATNNSANNDHPESKHLQHICEEFRKHDKYNRGLITSGALSVSLESLGLKFGHHHVTDALQFCTITSDGYVHYKDLINHLLPKEPKAKATTKHTLFPDTSDNIKNKDDGIRMDTNVNNPTAQRQYITEKTGAIQRVYSRWDRGLIDSHQFVQELKDMKIPLSNEFHNLLKARGPSRNLGFSQLMASLQIDDFMYRKARQPVQSSEKQSVMSQDGNSFNPVNWSKGNKDDSNSFAESKIRSTEVPSQIESVAERRDRAQKAITDFCDGVTNSTVFGAQLKGLGVFISPEIRRLIRAHESGNNTRFRDFAAYVLREITDDKPDPLSFEPKRQFSTVGNRKAYADKRVPFATNDDPSPKTRQSPVPNLPLGNRNPDYGHQPEPEDMPHPMNSVRSFSGYNPITQESRERVQPRPFRNQVNGAMYQDNGTILAHSTEPAQAEKRHIAHVDTAPDNYGDLLGHTEQLSPRHQVEFSKCISRAQVPNAHKHSGDIVAHFDNFGNPLYPSELEAHPARKQHPNNHDHGDFVVGLEHVREDRGRAEKIHLEGKDHGDFAVGQQRVRVSASDGLDHAEKKHLQGSDHGDFAIGHEHIRYNPSDDYQTTRKHVRGRESHGDFAVGHHHVRNSTGNTLHGQRDLVIGRERHSHGNYVVGNNSNTQSYGRYQRNGAMKPSDIVGHTDFVEQTPIVKQRYVDNRTVLDHDNILRQDRPYDGSDKEKTRYEHHKRVQSPGERLRCSNSRGSPANITKGSGDIIGWNTGSKAMKDDYETHTFGNDCSNIQYGEPEEEETTTDRSQQRGNKSVRVNSTFQSSGNIIGWNGEKKIDEPIANQNRRSRTGRIAFENHQSANRTPYGTDNDMGADPRTHNEYFRPSTMR